VVQLDTANESTDLETIRWFCQAVELGSGQAAFAIGDLYDAGFLLPSVRDSRGLRSDNVAPDMAIALACYRKAADVRNSDAMLKIASVYFAGDMIKGNPVARRA
jgi:TPR repeat protein